jgi:hypothetical protein
VEAFYSNPDLDWLYRSMTRFCGIICKESVATQSFLFLVLGPISICLKISLKAESNILQGGWEVTWTRQPQAQNNTMLLKFFPIPHFKCVTFVCAICDVAMNIAKGGVDWPTTTSERNSLKASAKVTSCISRFLQKQLYWLQVPEMV